MISKLTSDAGGGTAVPDDIGLLETGLGALSAPGTTSPNSFINDKYYIHTNTAISEHRTYHHKI